MHLYPCVYLNPKHKKTPKKRRGEEKMQDLKEKVENMPQIETNRKVVQNKKNGKWHLITETIIRTWTSLDLVSTMKKKAEEKKDKPKEEKVW